jgi:hypothetical protein
MLFPILKDTLSFYRQHISYFVAIMLPLVIPLEIFNAAVRLGWQPETPALTQELPYLLATLVVYPIYQGALVLAVHQLLQGNKPQVKDLWSRGSSFWFVIVVVNVIYYVAVFLGLMMFIIPGIFLAMRLMLAEQNAVLNMENPFEAIKSSWEDTSDQFGLIFFGSLILGVGTLLVVWPLYSVVGSLSDNSPIALIIPAVIQSLLYPLLVVFYMRVRHYIRTNE